MTNVTFCCDDVLISRKMFSNKLRSFDSRTPSALSRTNVTCVSICLLQSLSHCFGFPGTFVWIAPHEWIISVATSLNVLCVSRLQNKTVLSFSGLANSWATLLATVVFPNPGPPVTRTIGSGPVCIILMTSFISSSRPKVSFSGTLSGRKLQKLEVWSHSSCCSTFLQFSTCSATARRVSWSIGLSFRSRI